MAPESDERRLLVLGVNGQVGHELLRSLASVGKVTAMDRRSANLADPETLRDIVRALRPNAIVNAAAYTAVDKAESEPALAHTINAVAAGVVAQEAEAVGACMVHYSTDYVFDGGKSEPYVEGDLARPLSVYGQTKYAGELFVSQAARRHLILRTSWVFSARGTNFLRTMLKLAGEQDSLRVVSDQVGAPTTAALIADVTASLLKTVIDAPPADRRWGLYHLTAGGATSWHGFASRIIARARALGMPLKATVERVEAIRTADFPRPAQRPANSRLDTSRIRDEFGVQLPDWTSGVDTVLDHLKAA